MDDIEQVSRVRTIARTGQARQIRERALVSLNELASALGVSASSVSRWERGETMPRARRAIAWARILRGLDDSDPSPSSGRQLPS